MATTHDEHPAPLVVDPRGGGTAPGGTGPGGSGPRGPGASVVDRMAGTGVVHA